MGSSKLVTARGAARLLAEIGIGRGPARRILAAGLAGEPVTTSSALLYDSDLVAELLRRPSLDPAMLSHPADQAVLDLRAQTWDQTQDRVELPNAGCFTVVRLTELLARVGRLPLVPSCHSFVLGGADVTGVTARSATTAELRVEPAGGWFAAFEGRRVYTPPGNCWHLWTAEMDEPRHDPRSATTSSDERTSPKVR